MDFVSVNKVRSQILNIEAVIIESEKFYEIYIDEYSTAISCHSITCSNRAVDSVLPHH